MAMAAVALIAAPPACAQAQPTADAPTGTPSVAPNHRFDALLDQARALHRAGRADDAYRLLDAATEQYAGAIEFDYLLGITAIDAGKPARGIIALERVLAADPRNLQARAEIARAYYLIGETETARREFETVAASPIPSEVRTVIGRYLSAIAQADPVFRKSASLYAEVGFGHDSNVNLGSSANEWLLSGGIALTPLESSRPVSALFSQLGLGGAYSTPISGRWQWTNGFALSQRWNSRRTALDTGAIDASTGVTYRFDCHNVSLAAQFQSTIVGGSTLRDAFGGTLQWLCDVDQRTQLGAYLQGFALRYPDSDIRNGQRWTLGLSGARALNAGASLLMLGALYAGKETSHSDTPQLEHRLTGARLALSWQASEAVRPFGSVSFEARDYGGAEPLFDRARHDRQLDWRLGLDYLTTKSLVVTPQIAYTRNNSTIEPNDFSRLQGFLFARYRF